MLIKAIDLWMLSSRGRLFRSRETVKVGRIHMWLFHTRESVIIGGVDRGHAEFTRYSA